MKSTPGPTNNANKLGRWIQMDSHDYTYLVNTQHDKKVLKEHKLEIKSQRKRSCMEIEM
jgi:expansin (peptidoglycan-binding protein)